MSSYLDAQGNLKTSTTINYPHITIMGKSTDVKPSAVTYSGYVFLEADTGNSYWAAGGAWDILQPTGGNSTNNSAAYYFIFKDSANNFNCLNQYTDVIENKNTDATVTIQYAINNVGAKGRVVLDGGTYLLSTSLTDQTSLNLAGMGNQQSLLRPTGNYPAIIVSHKFVTLEDLFLAHNQSGYTSGLLQLVQGSSNGQFRNLTFLDFSALANAGNAIQFSNTAAASSFTGIYFHAFFDCSTVGFANSINMVITNTSNWINANKFSDSIFDGMARVLLCSYSGTLNSANMDANSFSNCQAQSETGNPLVTGFDYTDNATHNATMHSNIMTWDIPGGAFYMSVGSQNSNNAQYYLSSCYPSDDTHIGGSGAATLIASTALARDFNRNVAETLTNKSFDSTNKFITNSTGAGSAALGSNCPAVTATAPYTWVKVTSSDGSTVYIPAWK